MRAGASDRAATASSARITWTIGPAARPEACRRQVAIGVADEQDRLEEEQDGRPDRRCAAERRQGQPADQRLDREQQERGQGDRRREDRQDDRRQADQCTRGPARHGRLDAFGVGRHRPPGPSGMMAPAGGPGHGPVGPSGRRRWSGGAECPAASANRPLRIRDVDGNAWIVSARTSTGTRALIASTHSWIAADASGQAIAAPMSSRLARSTTIVTWPKSPRRHSPSTSSRIGDAPRTRRARRARLVDGQPDRRRLGVGVGRSRQGPVVGLDPLAERHPDRDLALVVGLVGVELGPGRIADDPQAVGHLEPAVARERASGPTRPGRSARARARRAGTPGRPRAGSRRPRRSIHRRDPRRERREPGPGPGPIARTPNRTVTPSRASALAIVSELRGWSVGISRGPDWTIVVGTPKRA